MATRLQVATFHRLTAEAVFETSADACAAHAALAQLKHARGLPMGGAVLCRADLTRSWDVRVGDLIEPNREREGCTCAS